MMQVTSFLKKFFTCIITGLTLGALWLSIGNSGTIAWLPPVIIFSLVGLSLLLALVFPFVWQYKERKQNINSEKLFGIFYAIIRYAIAFNLCRFGWAKLFGLQFNVPASVAATPINQLSGEWLTWYYFGHSFTFVVIIALLQISGAYLLLFRKTLLLAAIVLFALMLNITLVNIFYQMNAGALLQSVILTIGILFLILLDYDRLVLFFLKTKSNLPSLTLSSFTKTALRLSAIVLSLLFTLYLKSLIK